MYVCLPVGLVCGTVKTGIFSIKIEKFSSAVAEMGVSVQSSALVLGVLGAEPSPTC